MRHVGIAIPVSSSCHGWGIGEVEGRPKVKVRILRVGIHGDTVRVRSSVQREWRMLWW